MDDLAKLRADYIEFHRLSLATHDVDPVYPVYKHLLGELNATDEEGFWLTVCHLTWYDAGSALAAWGHIVGASPSEKLLRGLTELGLPCATERRGNRDPKQLTANLLGWGEVARAAGGIGAWVRRGLRLAAGESWRGVQEQVKFVHGNGRWAAYKAAEMFQKVNGLELKPLDMGHENSTGPRHGLEILFPGVPTGNDPLSIAKLNMVSEKLATGLRTPIEEVETTLCDFHALVGGRYYVGHDIDQMQAQLLRTPSIFHEDAWNARFRSLPHEYLGEYNGWDGPDPARRGWYKRTGEILTR